MTSKLKDHSTELRDEQLSKRPATALPWTFRESGPTKYGVLGSVHIPRERSVMSNNRDDAAYIVHAANSYPRLVEALRGQIKLYGANFSDETDSRPIAEIRALLRALGEIE